MELSRFYEAWGRTHLAPSALARDKDGVFSASLWESLAATGFFGLLWPKADGGAEQPAPAFVAAFRGLAKGACDLPFVLSVGAHAGVASTLFLHFADAAQRRAFAPALASGRLIASLANTEASSGTDLRQIGSTVVATGAGQGVATIAKSLATNAGAAGLVFASALAQADGRKPGLEVFLLERGSGVEQRVEDGLFGFRTGATGSVSAVGVTLDLERSRLGPPGSGPQVLRACYSLERFLIPVILSGLLDRMLELALERAGARVSRGKPLIDHQFVQAKVLTIFRAKELIDAQLSRLMTAEGALELRGFPTNSRLLSLLKWDGVEQAYAAATALVELMGGEGMKLDGLAQKMLRDVAVLKALGGSKEQHMLTIVAELLADGKPSDAAMQRAG